MHVQFPKALGPLLILMDNWNDQSLRHMSYSIVHYLLLFFQTNLPVFKVKESSVRRRYSDFDWLKGELERDSKVSHADTSLGSVMLQISLISPNHGFHMVGR